LKKEEVDLTTKSQRGIAAAEGEKKLTTKNPKNTKM
jgi:hypothetical protein